MNQDIWGMTQMNFPQKYRLQTFSDKSLKMAQNCKCGYFQHYGNSQYSNWLLWHFPIMANACYGNCPIMANACYGNCHIIANACYGNCQIMAKSLMANGVMANKIMAIPWQPTQAVHESAQWYTLEIGTPVPFSSRSCSIRTNSNCAALWLPLTSFFQ